MECQGVHRTLEVSQTAPVWTAARHDPHRRLRPIEASTKGRSTLAGLSDHSMHSCVSTRGAPGSKPDGGTKGDRRCVTNLTATRFGGSLLSDPRNCCCYASATEEPLELGVPQHPTADCGMKPSGFSRGLLRSGSGPKLDPDQGHESRSQREQFCMCYFVK